MVKIIKRVLALSGCCVVLGAAAIPAFAEIRIHKLIVASVSDMPPTSAGETAAEPMGQGTASESSLVPEQVELPEDSELFGLRGGYVHPYLTVGGEYTDNLYNLNDNEVSNMLWKVSPGIWFSLPRTREIPVTITPHNTSAGGLQLQLDDYQGTDKYQAYALGGLDFLMYSEDSNLDQTNGKAEGLFRYNMASGLSLQVLDRFSDDNDRFEYGGETRNYEMSYISNLFIGTADYQMTEKLRAKLDYTHFYLDYDETVNEFMNRADNMLDLYGYFLFSPKTSVFAQYRLADVAYDSAEMKDNTQHYLYGGVTWKTTEKLSLLFKAGYQKREYDYSRYSDDYDWDGLVVNFQSLYRWTEKTQFTLDFYRKSEESDSATALDKEVFGTSFSYKQDYTDKLSGLLNVMYEQADYTQLSELPRDDDRFYVRPALRYLFREWLMAEAAYIYDTRDSSDDRYDYTSNTVIFNLNLAL